MPFPPTYADAWDITQPPDTQLANLLGQDIRNLKLDIMQRMSTLSGTLANRPTPETVNAIWGGAGYGLIYLATDTNQIFQWNGASWNLVFIGNVLKFVDTAPYSATGVTGPINTAGIVIPVNNVGLYSAVRFTAWGGTTVSAGQVVQATMKFNGSTIGQATSPAGVGGVWTITGDLLFTGLAACVVTTTNIYNSTYSNAQTSLGLITFPITINVTLTPASGCTIGESGLIVTANP